jgi:hypothetical protein
VKENLCRNQKEILVKNNLTFKDNKKIIKGKKERFKEIKK